MNKDLPDRLYLNGEWRDGASGKRTPLVNPATEEPFLEVAMAESSDVDAAVKSAHETWESEWRDLVLGCRAEMFFNIAWKLREHGEEIAQLEIW